MRLANRIIKKAIKKFGHLPEERQIEIRREIGGLSNATIHLIGEILD